MRDVRDGSNPALHERYWEGQIVAAARGSLHWGFLAFFAGFGSYYLVSLVFGAVLSNQLSPFDTVHPPKLGPLLLLTFAPNVLLGLAPAVFSWWKGNGLRSDFGILPTLRDLRVGLACGGVALVCAWALTALLTSPLAFHLGALGRIDNGDGRFSIWNVAWVARTLVVDPLHVFDANIFYPHRGTLAYSETNLGAGILAIPAYWATGDSYAAHNFAGCIPGIHEVLRRQGLLAGTWCLDPTETLSPGQVEEIDRVSRQYPELTDDEFVRDNLDRWMR